MAFDAFLKIDGISGESTDDKHKDWIEVLSFQHGMSQPSSATASSSGGGTTERVNMDDWSITKLVDKSSPKLYEACASGKHFATVTLEVNRAGGDKLKYMEVKMEQVVISGVQLAGASALASGAGGANAAQQQKQDHTEQVTFNFGKIKWTYTQQKRPDGSGGGNVTGGWDLTANKINS